MTTTPARPLAGLPSSGAAAPRAYKAVRVFVGLTAAAPPVLSLMDAWPPLPPLPPEPPSPPPDPPRYIAPPQLPPPPQSQRCNTPTQKLGVPTPQPALHAVCSQYRALACCPLDRTDARAKEILAEVKRSSTCWDLHAAQKCAVECDPDSVGWEWYDFLGGVPYWCLASSRALTKPQAQAQPLP